MTHSLLFFYRFQCLFFQNYFPNDFLSKWIYYFPNEIVISQWIKLFSFFNSDILFIRISFTYHLRIFFISIVVTIISSSSSSRCLHQCASSWFNRLVQSDAQIQLIIFITIMVSNIRGGQIRARLFHCTSWFHYSPKNGKLREPNHDHQNIIFLSTEHFCSFDQFSHLLCPSKSYRD